MIAVHQDIGFLESAVVVIVVIRARSGMRRGRPLARIFHTGIEQRSGGGVIRLEFTEPNETATHRFFFDRV
jgi:hypothetical protein